jgi:alanyl-tRNA synthetase
MLEQSQLHEQLQQMTSTGSISIDDLMGMAVSVSGTLLIVAETPNANSGMMRQWIDQLRKKSTEPIAILLANSADEKVTLIAGISQSLVEKGFSAGKWITPVAETVGGGGGGKPDLAQAGGKLPAKLPEALQVAKDTWYSMLA